ncbi:MAG: hypothetical protein Q9N26_07150 [Aquificota bacterium]|nr:hypothetical protein [Aquificota bacterium]
MWGKVLKVLCEKAEGKDLYFLEADKDLNWYGVPILKVCTDVNSDALTREIIETIKAGLEPVSPGKFVAFLNPMSFFADIYPADKPRYRDRNSPERPFIITPNSLRVGFFDSIEEAADLFLEVSKALKKSEGIKFDVVYT